MQTTFKNNEYLCKISSHNKPVNETSNSPEETRVSLSLNWKARFYYKNRIRNSSGNFRLRLDVICVELTHQNIFDYTQSIFSQVSFEVEFWHFNAEFMR